MAVKLQPNQGKAQLKPEQLHASLFFCLLLETKIDILAEKCPAMFGGGKKNRVPLPQPPSAQEIQEDLEKAGPDDIVFTTDIDQLSNSLGEPVPANFQLKKRFEASKEDDKGDNVIDSSEDNNDDLYEKVIAYNQNVEKLETLGNKLQKSLENLLQSKEELTEDLAKVIQVHCEAVKQHQKINLNHGDDNHSSF